MSPHLPALTARELIAIVEKAGFVQVRKSGSHAIFRHADGRRVTIPVHSRRTIGRGLLRQILRDAGVDPQDLR